MSIEEALASVAELWVARPEIHGVYQSEDESGTPIIKVMVDPAADAVTTELPATVGGFAVLIVRDGPFEIN